MKKLLSVFIGLLFITIGHAAQIANVEYIHNAIKNKHFITVPYNSALTDTTVAANMEYLLTAVDRANKILHGEAITDYAQTFYATTAAVDTIAVNNAVDTLIKPGPYNFSMSTAEISEFSFKISAAGNFIISWGDGTVENINKANTTNTTYTHTYETTASYNINIGGLATAYSSDEKTAAISFYDSNVWPSPSKNITKISGSLGTIFPTLADGSQPRFYETFRDGSQIESIPRNLFSGIHGAPVSHMFNGTFWSLSGMTEPLPEGLFSGIDGAPQPYMFANTFNSCTNMTGPIPNKLFGNINGEPAEYMFFQTFNNDRKITGAIPPDLFSGIHGTPAPHMFDSTFCDCRLLTEIPGNLFANISGNAADSMFNKTFYQNYGITEIPDELFAGINGKPAINMFAYTFYKCTGLTEIPANLFANLDGPAAEKMFYYTFSNCSELKEIPGSLFAGIYGPPAPWMFERTFASTGITSIPAELFATISGEPARAMFSSTFSTCKQLTTVPENLFSGISGIPAQQMFYATFQNCSALTSVGEKLFGKISGTLNSYSFADTFNGCKALTGYSPKALTDDGYKFLYEIWPDATTAQANNTFAGDTLLTDYALERLKTNYEKYHNVTYSPEAIEACVRMSERYITDRCLPDKAIDVMDETGSMCEG